MKLIRWEEKRLRAWKLLTTVKTEWTLLSSKYTWVHFTIFIVHFTSLENSMAANTWERRLTNDPQWQKASFLPTLQYTEEPLSQNIRRIFHICEPMKGQVQSFKKCIQACSCQTCKVCACRMTFFFFFCGVFELASDTALASRGGLKCAPCLYKAIVCELPTLSLFRKTSFIAAVVHQVT